MRLKDLWDEDFSRVLSNGFDTLFLSGSDGKAFDLKCLTPKTATSFAPHRLGAIAHWASTGKKKVAMALNRNGEILVFKDEKLVFAKRRGKWVYFPHESFISRLGSGTAKVLREEIYKSCLDASFARTGACICLLRRTSAGEISKYVDNRDFLVQRSTSKTKLLDRAIRRQFHKLDRCTRQEILAIDGAMVIDHRGKVLAAGAIVKVPKGSQFGGGRRAAAIALSKLGVGIKVSADGPITAFRGGEEKPLLTIGAQ